MMKLTQAVHAERKIHLTILLSQAKHDNNRETGRSSASDTFCSAYGSARLEGSESCFAHIEVTERADQQGRRELFQT
jgi:hypothetical protein